MGDIRRIYEPFIEGYLRRRGISGELALDVRQEVLLVVSQKIAGFDYNGLGRNEDGRRRDRAWYDSTRSRRGALRGTRQVARIGG